MDWEESVLLAGYANIDAYFRKIVLPVLVISSLLFTMSLLLIVMYGYLLDLGPATSLLILVPLLFIILGILFIFIYPFYGIERVKVNIHENIHYFITYVGAMSTLHMHRKALFHLSAQRVEYGEIAKVMEKVAYLSDYWNLSLVMTCRKISTFVPSRVLGNFMDRMSAAFDFGERLDEFLLKEQAAVMEDFSTEYKQSLQTLSLIQDALVSLTIAVAFMMSISFMLPLIMGYDIYLLVGLSGMALLLIDILSIIFIDTFITHDDICHKLPIKAPKYIELKRLVLPITATSFILLFVLLWIRPIDYTCILVSIALTPLAVIGYYGMNLENSVLDKDQAFPAFIRSLGGSMSARGGSLYGTIGPLRIHEFGILNEPVERLYKRLRIRCDKFRAWMYFAGETGSSMIERFGSIFISIVNLGGDPDDASKIISDNFIRILSLRQLRRQLASSVKGVYYGTLIGVSGAAFASLRMVGILDSTFKKSFAAIASTPSVSSLTQGLLPTIGEINLPLVEDMLFFILLIHAAFSAFSVKMVDGGTRYAALLDFVIMLWFLTMVAIMVPLLFEFVFSQGASASGTVRGVTPGI